MVDKKSALRAIDPQKEPLLAKQAREHFDYLEKPNSPASAAVISVVNHMVLAGVPVSGLVNTTQMLTTTYPELVRQVGAGKGAKIWGTAAKDTLSYLMTPERLARTKPQLYQTLQAELERGILDAQAMQELSRLRQGYTGEKSLTETLMLTFSIPEKSNRVHAFIAGLEAARVKGLQGPEASKFAERMVQETQFDQSQANRPKIMQHPIGRVAFQYKNFAGNMLRFLRDRTAPGDRASLGVALAMLGAMGGISALPFVKESKYLAEGLGYDPATALRKGLGNKAAADAILYGAPTLAGANISGNVGVGELVRDIDRNPYEAIVRAGIGPAGDLLAVRPFKAREIYKQGEPWIAAETMLPRYMRGPSKVIRSLYYDKLKDAGGRTVLDQPTVPELAQVAIGATPQRMVDRYEQRHAQTLLDTQGDNRGRYYNQQLAKALANKDTRLMQQIRAEITEHNRTAQPADKIFINDASIRRQASQLANEDAAVITRTRKTQRGAMREIQGLYK